MYSSKDFTISRDFNGIWKEGGGGGLGDQHSTEVAFLLLTQQLRIFESNAQRKECAD